MRNGLMLTCLALCACGGGGGSNTTISLTTKPTSIPAGSTFARQKRQYRQTVTVRFYASDDVLQRFRLCHS